MKALWLREVQATVEREDFESWCRILAEYETALEDLRQRHEELLAQDNLTEFRAELTQKNAIDTLYQAGELEDSAATMLAETAEIENKAYEAVANFEAQRIAASELYSQMGAVEHNFLQLQGQVVELRATLERIQDDQRREHQKLLKKKQELLAEWDRRFREATTNYERGTARKMRLWEEVEQMWARSMDINLSVAERRVRSRLARKRAEQLFREAEQHKLMAERLTRDAEETKAKIEELRQLIEEHRTSAKRLFGCLVGEQFLYWPRRESNKEVYCLPLADQATGYNIEVRKKTIYVIQRQGGVEFLEPLPPSSIPQTSDDRRIDEFFSPTHIGERNDPA